MVMKGQLVLFPGKTIKNQALIYMTVCVVAQLAPPPVCERLLAGLDADSQKRSVQLETRFTFQTSSWRNSRSLQDENQRRASDQPTSQFQLSHV